jgi:hypothetical protein
MTPEDTGGAPQIWVRIDVARQLLKKARVIT